MLCWLHGASLGCAHKRRIVLESLKPVTTMDYSHCETNHTVTVPDSWLMVLDAGGPLLMTPKKHSTGFD
eukprot:1156310-Pelagomonas_calceolata.AAC.1